MKRSVPRCKEWKILLVDDEPDVIGITRFVLDGYEFAGRPFVFLEANSAQEAKEVIAQHPDISVAIIDIIMEEDDAGLELVRHLRDELGNQLIRLLIRTGQPGTFPPEEIFLEYEINDYLNKNDLTHQRLQFSVVAALRAYCDLKEIEYRKEERERILEEKLQQQALLIQQSKMAVMGEMLPIIAHQWRQPLSAINIVISEIEEMLSRNEMEDLPEVVADLHRFLEFMNDTMKSFTHFFRPEKTRHRFMLSRSVERVFQLLEGHNRAIQAQLTYEGEGIELNSIENELQQILLDLVKNALDQFQSGKKRDGKLRISARREGDQTVIAVEDNGGGISPEQQKAIFDLHYTTKGEEGTGIGLYMSRLIATESLGGELTCENTPEGARFILTLPA